MSDIRELTTTELDAVSGGTFVFASVPIGNFNGDGNINTSGVVAGGVGIVGNTITQVGNTSFSITKINNNEQKRQDG
jgi:hypothetical protein